MHLAAEMGACGIELVDLAGAVATDSDAMHTLAHDAA
jgi:hypothetical protein